jgi:hypothetical protein
LTSIRCGCDCVRLADRADTSCCSLFAGSRSRSFFSLKTSIPHELFPLSTRSERHRLACEEPRPFLFLRVIMAMCTRFTSHYSSTPTPHLQFTILRSASRRMLHFGDERSGLVRFGFGLIVWVSAGVRCQSSESRGDTRSSQSTLQRKAYGCVELFRIVLSCFYLAYSRMLPLLSHAASTRAVTCPFRPDQCNTTPSCSRL